jgi:hypothetical protein
MRCPTDFYSGKRLCKWNSLFPILFLPIILLISCTGRPEPYSILEFTGKGLIYNYSRSLFPILYEADSVNPTALLACNGDIITYGDFSCFYYRGPSQNKFSVKTIKNEGFINDKINSVFIPGNDSMIPWFEKMKTTDISELGFLYFQSAVSESYIPYLTDLAKTKPNIGLGYEGTMKDMSRLFEIFKPEFLVGADLSGEDFNLLSGLTTLRFLAASLNDSVYTLPLPALSTLKQLILSEVNDDAGITDDFLINNKQIERLRIIGSGNFNLKLINPLENLKELIIEGFDTIAYLDQILNHGKLELLSVAGSKSGINMGLKELPGIRWMTFYEETTQDVFNSFIDSHPDVEVVEIFNNVTISNLQPLLKLRNLYGLTVTDTVTDLAAIKSLKSLKYLSLPDKLVNDSIIKADLLKSLPGTKIVANQGVCLGSGWLLLIIPLIFTLGLLNRNKSFRVQGRPRIS